MAHHFPVIPRVLSLGLSSCNHQSIDVQSKSMCCLFSVHLAISPSENLHICGLDALSCGCSLVMRAAAVRRIKVSNPKFLRSFNMALYNVQCQMQCLKNPLPYQNTVKYVELD